MSMSYLDSEDEQSFTVKTPSGGVVQYQKQPNFNVPGGVYDVAAKAAAQMKPAAPVAPAVNDSANAFNTAQNLPGLAFQPPPVDLPPYDPTKGTAADPAVRQPSQRPQVAPAVGTGLGTNVVQLGSSSTVTERPINDPRAMADMESAYRNAAKHTENAYAAEGKIQQERGETFIKQAQAKEQMAADRQNSADAAQAQFRDYQQKAEQLQKDYANTEIRPAGYFEGNLGSNIMAGIGIMLGAVGGALQGTGKNAAVDVIERAIDRDLNAQKMNLDKKREAISVLGQNYQAARQAGFDDSQARLLARADAYDAIAAYTEAKVAPLQGQVIGEKGMAAAAEIRAKGAADRVKATAGSQKTTDSSEAKVLEGKGKGEKLPEAAAKDAAGHVSAHYAIGQLRELYEVLDGAQTGVMDGRINELRSKFGLQDADAAKIQQRIKTFAQDRIKNLTGAGSSDAERAEIEKTLPRLFDNPEAFRAKIEQLDEDNARNYMLIEKQYQNPAGYTYQDLQSPGASRARVTVHGKPTTATKPR